MPESPPFDPTIIEQFAIRLYRRADALARGMVVTGVLVGAGFGSIPLTPLGSAWPIPAAFGFATLLAGAVCGGLIGFVIGDTRAFGFRFQAQMALRQLQVERETRAAIDEIRGLRADAETHFFPPPAPTPEPVPDPVPAAPPEPVAAGAAYEQPPVSPPRLYGKGAD